VSDAALPVSDAAPVFDATLPVSDAAPPVSDTGVADVESPGQLAVLVANDVNNDGVITALDALMLANGSAGGAVGVHITVHDAAGVLVTQGDSTANPSPLTFTLPAACYQVTAQGSTLPPVYDGTTDSSGRLCVSGGVTGTAIFLLNL
jgi:hypothetical protein